MKLITILLISLFTMHHLTPESVKIGELVKKNGEIVTLHTPPKSANKKFFKKSKIPKECDCVSDGADFYFYDNEMKRQGVIVVDVVNVKLEVGARICQYYSLRHKNRTSSNMPSYRNEGVIPFELETELNLLSLPQWGADGNYLHTVLAYNSKFKLAMPFSPPGMVAYIFDEKNRGVKYLHPFVKSEKKSKKIVSLLQKYFSDCDNIMEIIESNMRYNETVKKSKRKFITDGLYQLKCE